MKWLTGLFILVVVGVAPTNALVIPYSGGKLADSVTIRTLSNLPSYGSQGILSTTTIELGNEFVVRFRWLAKTPLAGLCSMTDVEYDKFFVQVVATGEVRQLADSGSDWQLHSMRPPDSALVPVGPLPFPSDSITPLGFRFALGAWCEGTYEYVTGKWNRLIFIRNGTRYAKLAIVARQDTSWGTLPGYSFFKSITFRYVVNDSNELSDPVSILPAVKRQPDFRSGRYGNIDLYNLLGVRLKREARPQEVVIPLRR
jgi:hypothetical protein